jgi:flagellar hook protein FlgE
MSLNISLSGLRSSTQQLDVISQNIANSATAGFKSSRTEFSAIVAGGSPGGVEVTRVSQNFEKDGAKEFTGRPLDMAISGEGFFMVKDGSGQSKYTRAGMFGTDNQNNIISSSGMKLQGYGVNDVTGVLEAGKLVDLKVGSSSIPANASTSLEFKSNFKADAPIIPVAPPFDKTDANTFNFSYSSELYDSLGNTHTMTQYMVKDAANDWTAHYEIGGSMVSTQNVTFNTDGTMATPVAPVNLAYAPAGADPMNIALDMAGTTQYAGEFSVSRNSTDGYTSGDLAGISVSDEGDIIAQYTNGRDTIQGKVALANFTNPQGLMQSEQTTWTQTFSSGNAVTGEAGTGTLGTLTSGAYEQSNVELTNELVGLMTSQRNYQANAKSMSTSDQMTQTLFQTIR